MYKLFYFPNNASLAPHFLLHYMKLDYELILVDRKANAQKSKDYLKLNPAGRIPTLIDNDNPIFESAAICIHLCEQHPQHRLIPELGTTDRPIFFQWLAYLTNTLQAELMIHYYPHRHTTDENAIAGILAAQAERIGESLQIIDTHLVDHEYMLGNEISALDFFLFMLSQWSLVVKKSPLHFTHLANHLQRLARHPSIRAVCNLENISLKPFEGSNQA